MISDRRPWYLFWEELDQQGGGIETVISTFYNLGLCSRCDTSLPEGFGVVYWIELWSSVQNSAKARADVLGLRTVEFYQSEKFLKFSEGKGMTYTGEVFFSKDTGQIPNERR